MGKMKAKKGIFFTFIAIVIMTVFILVLTPQADISLQKDTQAVRTKISVIDNYVESLENSYFSTALRSSAFKSMLSLAYYMNTTGKFITNFDSAFSEVIINGTLNNVPIDSITGRKIMENNTLTNLSKRIAKTAQDTYNVNTTIIIVKVSANQTQPWEVDLKLVLNLTVKSNVAEWKRIDTVTATTSVEGLYDPYYLVNTVSRSYGKRIKQSKTQFNKWDVTQVKAMLMNGTYVYWKNPKAPGYLMRFVNSTSGSECCGIESSVDPNKIAPSDIRASYIDYLFWSYSYNQIENCTSLYNITNPATGGGVWDEFRYFKMDFEHVIMYNITSNDAVRNC